MGANSTVLKNIGSLGSENAPATFQRLANILRRMCSCDAYLDDALLQSNAWTTHLDPVKEFKCVTAVNLTVNLAEASQTKTILFKNSELEYSEMGSANDSSVTSIQWPITS